MVEQKLRKIFCDVFSIDEKDVIDELAYSSIPTWDSVAHMAMVAEVEETFDIMIDTDDIVDMRTFKISVGIVERVVAEQNG